MKRYRKLLVVLTVLAVLFVCLPYFAHAQIDPADPGFDPDAPIDGGLGILLAAGVGYGIKKMRDNKRKKDALS